MCLFVALELPKETNLLVDLPLPSVCHNWGLLKVNHYMVNNMPFDPLQDLVYSEACLSFIYTCTELFKHINIKKQNTSCKIRNHLPAILPNQIYHTNRSMTVKLPLGEYQYSKMLRKHRENRESLEAFSSSCCTNYHGMQANYKCS